VKTFLQFYIIYGKDIYEAEEIIINKLKAEQSVSYEIKAHFIGIVSFERNDVN